MKKFAFLTALFAACYLPNAYAHALYVFAQYDGQTLSGKSYYSDMTPAAETYLEVFRSGVSDPVFPAFLIALLLQVIFFSFGGFAVLGVNLCVMATPAVIAHYLFRSRLQPNMALKDRLLVGIGAGVIGVGGAGALASFVLMLDGGKSYLNLVWLLLVSHIPVFILDSIISVGVITLLGKMYPEVMNRTENFS